MASADSPLIADRTNLDEGGGSREDSGNVVIYSQTAAVDSPATLGRDESTDVIKSSQITPNGRRNTHSNKKQKTDAAGNFSSGGDYRKEREEWGDSAIAVLLDAYIEKFTQLNRSNLRGRDWEEVAELVSEGCDKQSRKSIEQCKNKIDNLKKRYKVELQRMTNNGSNVSNWNWFKKMEIVVGNVVLGKNVSDDDRSVGGNSVSNSRRSARLAPSVAATVYNTNSISSLSSKWKRVVFKVSGTALGGSSQNIDPKVVLQIAEEVATACHIGVEVAIVVGGRNFFCGDSWVSATGLDRPTTYQIGMMATVMNSILLQSALEKLGIQTRVQSAFAMPEVAEPYNRLRAMRHLDKGRVVIFGGIGAGTGNPLFTTDTAAALRASEINADAVLKGTNVDGVYNKDVIMDRVSFREVVSRDITAMDLMAIQFCEENGIDVVIFNLLGPGNVSRALSGEQVGTLICQE